MFTMKNILPEPQYTLKFNANKWYDYVQSMKFAGVYVFKSETEILYTGKSVNVGDRLKQHIFGSHNIELSASIKNNEVHELLIFPCESDLDAIVLERYFIAGDYYRGKYNVVYVPSELDLDSLEEVNIVKQEKEVQDELDKEKEEKKELALTFWNKISFIKSNPRKMYTNPETIIEAIEEFSMANLIKFGLYEINFHSYLRMFFPEGLELFENMMDALRGGKKNSLRNELTKDSEKYCIEITWYKGDMTIKDESYWRTYIKLHQQGKSITKAEYLKSLRDAV